MLPQDITPSAEQTKKWRMSMPWYVGGKSNECEIYQRKNIESITEMKCPKTILRLHSRRFILAEKKRPHLDIDGFEWTEDFDGRQEIEGKILLYNLKMVCGKGGAQTRTCHLVYDFIYAQRLYLENNIVETIFINILDGDECNNNMNKFRYAAKENERIYVGDLYEYQTWFRQKLTII